ncbi:MAG: hypothetical protein HFF17_15770 [Oscillospiraceae bacterium]|nr:hypothetical protein [Oscillospiraceae bacterium]
MAATTTRDATKTYSTILSELTTRRPVIVTDGTLTRKVVQVDRVPGLTGTDDGTLDLLDENNNWWCIKVEFPFNQLDGWAGAWIDGIFYIAPYWWIEL